MSNLDRKPKEHAANITAKLAQTPKVAWEETSGPEQALLLRVETKLLAAHDEAARETEQRATRQATKHQSPSWSWGWVASALACLCAALWVWWPHTRQLPTLQVEGTLKVTTQPSTNPHQQVVQSILQQHARLHDPQGWEVRSHTTSKLRITRNQKRESTLQLRQGAITIHVTPHAMKRFVVTCGAQLQVVVKGTRLLVWQGRSGLRIEVTKGHVMLRQRERVLLHLYQGQGAYFKGNKGDTYQTYRIPTADQRHPWLAKIEMLAQQQSEQVFAYASDLATGKLLPRSLRLQAIEAAAHALQGAKRWDEASHLWLSVHALQSNGYSAQTALYQAAQSCRLGQTQQTRCARLYQRYLREFPQGLPSLRETSLFWMATMQTNQTNKQGSLRKYLQLHPTGIYATRARQLLSSQPAPTP